MYSHRRMWRIRNAFVIIFIFSLIPASLDLFGMGGSCQNIQPFQ